MLYVVMGVRGCGKTTLVESIKRYGMGVVLQPSTTRGPRYQGEAEYNFVDHWDTNIYAWAIEVGPFTYGMRKSEVDKAKDRVAFTVFDPISIEVFYRFQRNSNIPALVIGLDTVHTLIEQHQRVGMAPSRLMTSIEFETARGKVYEADIRIDGGQGEVLAKVRNLLYQAND